MTKFAYTPPEEDNEDRVYVRVDDLFDISILRVEEGVVIDVFDNDEIDLLGTLTVDEDSLARNREKRPLPSMKSLPGASSLITPCSTSTPQPSRKPWKKPVFEPAMNTASPVSAVNAIGMSSSFMPKRTKPKPSRISRRGCW